MKTGVKELLNKVKEIYDLSQQQKIEKENRGENFNIFTILGLRTEEVRLHSAFLAELLNPKGQHGMKGTFLAEFLHQIGISDDYLNPTKINPKIVERSIGTVTDTTGGRIDIILDDGKHAIIIENKINAGDQEHQLLRYDNYAKKYGMGNYKIIYLTKDGHEASERSTGSSNLNYIRLSYAKDIIIWLQKCACDKTPTPVKEAIKQYITLLKQITNQDMDTEKIVKLALNNLEATVELLNAKDNIAKTLKDKYIIKPLEVFAQNKGLLYKDDDSIQFWKGEWKKYKIVIDFRASSYIGLTSGQEEEPKDRLGCFDQDSTTWWPYGYEYLPEDNWWNPNNFPNIKNGELTKWIIDKINNILQEVKSQNIQL